MKKTIGILLIAIFIITILQNNILASSSIDTNYQIGTTPTIHMSDDVIGRILGYLQVIGSIVSVAALAIIGLRYMFSSVEEQAKVKEVLLYYIIGAILVFATSNILSIAWKVISGIHY